MTAVSTADVLRRVFGRVWLLVAALAVLASECGTTKSGW